MKQRKVGWCSLRISLIWASIIGLIACSQITTGLYNGYQGTGSEARHYTLVQKYYRQGDYQRSLEESLTLISQYPKSTLYDKALFYAALNKLHLGSPDGDYSEASSYFKRLAQECPNSLLQAESNTWIAVLTALSLRDNEIAALQKELGEKKSRLALFQEEKAETMQQLKGEMELKVKQLQRKKSREIAQLQKEMNRLRKELELLKKVDVQLEQRKKDLRKSGTAGHDKGKNPGSRR